MFEIFAVDDACNDKVGQKFRQISENIHLHGNLEIFS